VKRSWGTSTAPERICAYCAASLQAVLYVLCYRMEAIADSGKVPLVEMRSLPLERHVNTCASFNQITDHRSPSCRLLNHALQPLRACAPAIAHEYSRRAKQLRMPGRSAARAAAALHNVDQPNATRSSRQTRPLDTFFPFDPYLLRASSAQLDLKRCYIRCETAVLST
jgi:RNA polymerase I-specific transcription initiation factor RRN3